MKTGTVPGTGMHAQSGARWPLLERSRIVRDYLSAEQFASCCDQTWSTDRRSTVIMEERSAPGHATLLYAKQDHSIALFAALEKKRKRVVLITAESDDPVDPLISMPSQVAAWFGVNANREEIRALPLGLGNSYCRLTTKANFLADVGGMGKTGWLYANFRVETNPAQRLPLLRKFESTEWAGFVSFSMPELSGLDYARALASHRYVLCPAGNGTDTHRMWEALYAGTIPVVEQHPSLDCFRDLPILFVDKLTELDRGFLEKSYQLFLERTWNSDKLFLPYWQRQLEEARSRIRCCVSWAIFLRQRFNRAIKRRS
jgi:hypothetical protein